MATSFPSSLDSFTNPTAVAKLEALGLTVDEVSAVFGV